MRKTVLFLFALVALFSILSCVVLEPAFAYKDEAVHSEENADSDCCFIHCSMHHQWISSQASGVTHPVLLPGNFVPASIASHHDSPAGSIFHPPLAF